VKKISLVATIGLSVLLAINCSPSKKSITHTTPTVPTSTNNIDESMLAQGKTLWETKCISCHKLYPPESRPKEKWEAVLPKMLRLSKLDETQAKAVRSYIFSQIR
jgi:hypothetical protein